MNQATDFPVEKMCKVFGVSRSGYYRWRQHRSDYDHKYEQLDEQIKEVFKKSERTYGSPRIAQALNQEQVKVSKSTIARRMHALKIRVKARKRYVVTTQSKHEEPIAANILERDFSAPTPVSKWVSDITYFRVHKRWYYLTVILDLAYRAVVGWAISDNMSATATTQAAFERAIANRPPKKGLLFHSDRGGSMLVGTFAGSSNTISTGRACPEKVTVGIMR